MAMSDLVDFEDALVKTGPNLFKELLRVYPVADPEDYFKNGQWKNEAMKCDLVLLEAHLRECGAPDPVDLDDVKLPEMPQGAAGAVPLFAGFKPQGLAVPGMGVRPGMPSPLTTGAATAGSAPVVEIRLIALFVAKWKLDPVLSKTSLAKLTAPRRRYVIQNFKTAIAGGGAEATKELETYIAACEKDGSWDTVAANGTNGSLPATVRPPVITPRPVGGFVAAGLKQPGLVGSLGANPAWQQNKRPALGMGVVPAGMVRPAGPAGIVRPPAPKANLISGLLSGF